METEYITNGDDETQQEGKRLRSWFVAPTTARYRFYMNCDDKCNLYLGETPGSAEDPTLILEDVRNDW